MHYNRFRYYEPSTGRYISADPIGQFGALLSDGVALARFSPMERQETRFGFRQAFSELTRLASLDQAQDGFPNLFSYGANNPLRFTDPTGLLGWDTVARWIAKQIGKILGGKAIGSPPGCGTLDGCDQDGDGIYDWNDNDKDGDGTLDVFDPDPNDPNNPNQTQPPPNSCSPS